MLCWIQSWISEVFQFRDLLKSVTKSLSKCMARFFTNVKTKYEKITLLNVKIYLNPKYVDSKNLVSQLLALREPWFCFIFTLNLTEFQDLTLLVQSISILSAARLKRKIQSWSIIRFVRHFRHRNKRVIPLSERTWVKSFR